MATFLSPSSEYEGDVNAQNLLAHRHEWASRTRGFPAYHPDSWGFLTGCIGRAWALVLVAAALLAFPGCKRADPFPAIIATATTNRAGATAALVAAHAAGTITVDDALSEALDRLQAGEDCTGFGGAVLDFAAAVESKLPMGGEFEMFWFRVGRVAFWSSLRATELRRDDEAATLMLAGPARWQTEGYWTKYPDHDALVSIIMAGRGDRAGALRRLEDRGILQGEAEEVYEQLRSAR